MKAFHVIHAIFYKSVKTKVVKIKMKIDLASKEDHIRLANRLRERNDGWTLMGYSARSKEENTA